MSIVIDSSITLAWLFDDERNAASGRILDTVVEGGAWVPAIWRLEVANGLQQGIKRRRFDPDRRSKELADLAKLDISVDPDTNSFAWSTTMELADRYGLTPYDACYLELAQRRDLPLATLDNELRKASKKLGVPLL